MSDDFGCKVRDLLPDSFEHMDDVIEEKLRSEPAMSKANLPGFAWHVIGSKASDAIHDTLDCDVFELLAQGWCKARELHEYTDRVKHPPDQESIVTLGTHNIAKIVHPSIVVTVYGIECVRLRFTLELSADFHSAALTIRDGHITAIGAGDCAVSAQLKMGEVALHERLQSRKVALGNPVKFSSPGLAIG